MGPQIKTLLSSDTVLATPGGFRPPAWWDPKFDVKVPSLAWIDRELPRRMEQKRCFVRYSRNLGYVHPHSGEGVVYEGLVVDDRATESVVVRFDCSGAYPEHVETVDRRYVEFDLKTRFPRVASSALDHLRHDHVTVHVNTEYSGKTGLNACMKLVGPHADRQLRSYRLLRYRHGAAEAMVSIEHGACDVLLLHFKHRKQAAELMAVLLAFCREEGLNQVMALAKKEHSDLWSCMGFSRKTRAKRDSVRFGGGQLVALDLAAADIPISLID